MSAWRLVVLGIAQDGGLPHAGCACARCTAARNGERPRERVACLGLTDGERGYLFDATPDLPDQLHALGVTRPAGIFLTHAHMGHVTGLAYLGREAMATEDVPVYATPSMQSFLLGNAPWSALDSQDRIRLEDNAHVDLGGVRVTALPVPHRHEFSDTVGYLIEGRETKALFIPDIDAWDAWERDIAELVAGVDHAFLDGSFLTPGELQGRDQREVAHPPVTDTMERLEGLGERVWFIHLNHTNPLHDDPSPAERRGFHVAREGDEFRV